MAPRFTDAKGRAVTPSYLVSKWTTEPIMYRGMDVCEVICTLAMYCLPNITYENVGYDTSKNIWLILFSDDDPASDEVYIFSINEASIEIDKNLNLSLTGRPRLVSQDETKLLVTTSEILWFID